MEERGVLRILCGAIGIVCGSLLTLGGLIASGYSLFMGIVNGKTSDIVPLDVALQVTFLGMCVWFLSYLLTRD